MQIFTPKFLKESKRSLTVAFRNLKTLISLVNTGKQVGILRESRIYISGKRYLSLIFLCLSMGFSGSVVAQANFVASPASVSIAPDDTFTIIISLETGSGQLVDGAEIHMDFDPSILQVSAVTSLSNSGGNNQFPTEIIGAPTFDNSTGNISYVAGNASSSVVANFQFLQIDFQAIGTPDTSIDYVFSFPFRLTDISLAGGSVLGTTNNIPVTIASANQDPTADFTIVPNPAETNQVVTFNGSLSSDDGSIVSYAWDFGDGNTEPASGNTSTTHSYTAANTYTVFLTVADNLGATNTTSKTIVVNSPTVTQYTINASAGPNGSIDPEGAVSVNEGDAQSFTITPDPGFEITEILVGGSPVPITTSYEFTNVQANSDIAVTFGLIPPFQVCIASGNDAITALGRTFEADNVASPNPARTGGSFFINYSGPIAGTTSGSNEELLFQKEVYGGNNGANNALYSIAVPDNGIYQVDLYFAEVFHPSAGGRIFDVFLEGNLMLDEYDLVDPIKDGLGSNQTAITRTYYVQITDGAVDVQIGPASTDNGKISGICVTEVASGNLHPVSAIGDLTYDALVEVADPLNILDPESDVLSVVLNGMPASLTYNPATNQLEGTPLTTDANTYTINAIISDGTNSPVTEEFTLVINPAAGDDPPTIDAIADLAVNEGEAISQAITVTDDNLSAATIEIFDVSEGGTNNPFNPTTAVAVGTLVDNTGGSYTFNWTPAAGTGRSYLARVTADDGVNPVVIEEFRINVAQQLPGIILARTFNNPVPWYGSSTPGGGLTVAIETSAAKNIGYIDNNDFVEYLINVPAAGTFDVEIFAGKGNAGTTVITLSTDSGGGFVALGSVNVIETGWQTYVSYTTQVNFTSPGLQTFRLDFNGGVNIRDFNFTSPNDTSPTIDAIADLQVNEGDAISQAITVTDDNLPAATIEIFDVSEGGTNNPFNPTTAVAVGTLVDNTGGSYTFNWTPATGTGRSYLARVTADDGVNPAVIEEFRIDVAQQLPGIILARTFNNPVPWYGGNPGAGFTVAIETAGNIGWIGNGEFVEYLINVPTPGSYNVRFSSSNGSSTASNITILEEGNATPIGIVNVPVTDWTPFIDYNVTVALANSGLQTLRLEFDGGVNTNEFEFTSLTGNTAPVVNITTPANGTIITTDTNINFTGTAIDNVDGDISATIAWSSDLDNALGSGASINTTLTVGTHIITAEATDLDGTTPLTGNANITVVVVQEAPSCDVRFRVNAGGPSVISATGDFEEDQATALVGGTAQTGTPSTYVNTAPPAFDKTFGNTTALVSNTTGYPDYLFQTERYSDAANPDNMQWSFPTGDGVFDVKILFNENWVNENANVNNNRIFDVIIEGDIVLDDYRPSGPTGADFNVAKVETYTATVVDGVLNIDFEKINQNPAVKGFDICFVSDLPTDTPPVVTISSPTDNTTPVSINRLVSTTFTAAVVDAEDDDTTLTDALVWTIDPFEANFAGSGGTFDDTILVPGVYTIRASSTDSDGNTAFDDIQVTVLGPDVEFTSPSENADLTTTDVQVTWTATNMNYGGATPEHFHLWVNPVDPNNLVPGDRISTASFAGQLFWDLTAADGIVEGANKVIIIAADNGHAEFLNTEARDEVNFNVLGDTTDPTITCPPNIVVDNDPGLCGAVVTFTAPVGEDDRPGAITTQTAGLASGDTFPVGTTTQTFLVTDAAGLTATCSFDVTVNDTEDPILTCPADDAVDVDINGEFILQDYTSLAAVSDNCDNTFTVTQSPVAGTTLSADTQVTLSVTDNASNTGTCTFNVTISADTTDPLISCPADIVVDNDPDQCGAVVTFTAPVGTDERPGATTNQLAGLNSGDFFPLGITTQTYNVVDAAGNMAQCSFTITINDGQAPDITCPADIAMTSLNGNPIVISDIGTATALDNCPGAVTIAGVTLIGDQPIPDTFPVGTTQIKWTAMDVAGNVAQCIQNITVNFTASSEKAITAFSLPGQVGPEVIAGTSVNLTVALGTDLSVPIVPSNIAISDFAMISPDPGVPQTFNVPVEYTVTAQDNSAQVWTVNVTVEPDTEDPTVTCPADITVDNDAGECGAIVNFTDDIVFNDNLPGATVQATPASGSLFPVGTTQVSVTVTDAAGLTATCTFDVTVNDTEAPEITCPVDQTVQGDLAGNAILPDFTALAAANDNCDPSVVVTQSPAPGTNVSGTVLVTLTATDADLNSATCTFSAIIEPATLASLTITPSAITVNLVQGGTTIRNYVVDSDDASTLPTPAAMSIIDNATSNPASWASTTSAANQGTTYEVNFDATGLAPGTYNATLTAGPVTGYTNASIPVTLIVEPAVGNGALIVLDATTDTPLFDLTDGLSIPKSSIGNTPLGIIFNTDFNPGGVQFTLTGPINENRFEGPAPHSLFGDIGVNIQGKPFPIGNYTLVADPNVGPTITINFAVTDVDPVCVNFDASLSGITNPSTCAGVGSATAVPTGGVSPYTYQWDNGETAATAINLVVGPHSVIVGDANGCSKTLTFTITGPPLPIVTLAPFASVLNTAPAFPLTGGSPAGGTYSGAGVTGNTFNPAIGVGTYAITYSYTDINGCANSATQGITVTTEISNAALIVLDATDDSVLFALTDGLQINKAVIGNTPLGVIFNDALNPGGVAFNLSGPINETRFEGPAPRSLFGDIGVNIQGKPFPVGNYTLVADPNNGPTITVNFSVIDGPPGNQSPLAIASGTVDPVTPFKVNFSSAGSMDPDGDIVGYLWNFGDGMTSIAQNPMHIYATGGTKTVTLTVTDNQGATGSTNIQVTAVDPNDADKVVSFTLVDAVANSDIIDMVNSYVISNGTGINIRANTDPGVVGSVKFVLSGTVSYTRTESVAPYALYGDDSANYIPADLPVGLYTLTATPYSASGGNGTAGQPLTIDFSVGIIPLMAAKAPVNTMSIAPNPANEEITMTFEEPAQIQEIMIFDVTGRLIKTIKEPLRLDAQTIDVKVYDLPIGTYFLKTRDDKGFEYQQQMLIDRY